MKPLYTEQEFTNAGTEEKLPIECYICHKPFYKLKRVIQRFIRNQGGHTAKFCSKQCQGKDRITKQSVSCENCNKSFLKVLSQIKKTKNHFCSCSCAATYNNTHKQKGIRRSKLENFLEQNIKINFPNLPVICNASSAIEMELDFFFPSLNMAIEINGILHYKPIFGKKKLKSIKKNDYKKRYLCLQKGIILHIIPNVEKRFTEDIKSSFWNHFISIIKQNKYFKEQHTLLESN